MTRALRSSIAIVAGIALGAIELVFAPSLVARMNADPFLAKTVGAGMVWAAAVSIILVGGGIAAIFVRSRN